MNPKDFYGYRRKSINRNIVECKGFDAAKRQYGSTVLIETLWNVKVSILCSVPNSIRRINRNIVECKVKKTLSGLWSALVLIETLWNVKI